MRSRIRIESHSIMFSSWLKALRKRRLRTASQSQKESLIMKKVKTLKVLLWLRKSNRLRTLSSCKQLMLRRL
jgi:hypothetical protein